MSDEESEVLTWHYYDSAKAFPHSTSTFREGVIQEMAVSLSSSLGGTAGEFNIHWHKFANVERPACRVNIFSDAWRLADDTGILSMLAALGEDPTYEQVAAKFTDELCAVDVTLSLLQDRQPPRVCPCCGRPEGD